MKDMWNISEPMNIKMKIIWSSRQDIGKVTKYNKLSK